MSSDAVEPLWTPSPQVVEQAVVTAFQRHLAETRGLDLPDYHSLWQWSVDHLNDFWLALWEFYGLDRFSEHQGVALADDAMPGAVWFPGTQVNYAAYLLEQGQPDDVAIIATDESGAVSSLTRAELRAQTAAIATALRDRGVGLGDVVVGYVPNVAESVVAFLATASLGAIWSSVGQDYAPAAAVDRLGQLRPKVLVTADGYRFGGREHGRLEAVATLQEGIETLEHTIVISHLGEVGPDERWQTWAEALATPAAGFDAVQVPFDHPLWVLFSSGTTGRPKGLVHGHGGMLVETLKTMSLHWDAKEGDRVFWYTSPSWVMWNLQLASLAVGASIVCYDGNPVYPDPSTLWRIVAEQQVTFFGMSPGYLQASESAGVRPAADFDLSHLQVMSTTGSPLSPHSHRWATREVGEQIPLYSVSGGTDIASGFVGGIPIVPIWPGELSVPCLGVALDAWDEEGRSVRGEVGELVVTRPMPTMPVHLWDDPDGEKYRDAYYSTYPDAWRQGDWITITEHGSIVIHGRSDSTLNRNGVRMGSADIYSAVETIPEVLEALVIGAEQPDGGYWMPLFVTLVEGQALTDELRQRIVDAIREKASPRHVPDDIVEVRGIPHTRTGKKLEVPVKRLLQGQPLERVANPDAVDDASLLEDFARFTRTSY
ncbi:MAG: acetoacetate--CoA ligase [Micrococcales bacterium]|nr:acetoacetate--CoA ligase [Micrococcales bacterium]